MVLSAFYKAATIKNQRMFNESTYGADVRFAKQKIQRSPFSALRCHALVFHFQTIEYLACFADAAGTEIVEAACDRDVEIANPALFFAIWMLARQFI